MPSENGHQPLHLSEKWRRDGAKMMQTWIRVHRDLARGDIPFRNLIHQFAKLVINEALIHVDGNKSKAAKLLGLARPTLMKKMRKYDIEIDGFSSNSSRPAVGSIQCAEVDFVRSQSQFWD